MLDMVDLCAAFLVFRFSWDVDEIKLSLKNDKNSKEGYKIFIKAIITDMSNNQLYYHEKDKLPKLPYEEKVVSVVKKLSDGSFNVQSIVTLPYKVKGNNITQKKESFLSHI